MLSLGRRRCAGGGREAVFSDRRAVLAGPGRPGLGVGVEVTIPSAQVGDTDLLQQHDTNHSSIHAKHSRWHAKNS